MKQWRGSGLVTRFGKVSLVWSLALAGSTVLEASRSSSASTHRTFRTRFRRASSTPSNPHWDHPRHSLHKLVYTSRQFGLYDLLADPLETTNLYASAPHAAARATLEAEIAALKSEAPAGSFFP